MWRRLAVISAILAGLVALVGVVSFVHPLSESQTVQRIGDPRLERNLFVALDDGTLMLKLGVPVQPPLQPARNVDLAVLRCGVIDLPGKGPGYRLYAVSMSLWFPFAVFAALPLAWWWRVPFRRARRKRRGCCESCGYDLHGNLSGTCPECGARVLGSQSCPSARKTPEGYKNSQ